MVLLYSKFQELMVLFLNPTYIHLTKSVFLLLFKLLYGLVFVKGEILRLTYISYTQKNRNVVFQYKAFQLELFLPWNSFWNCTIQLVLVWTTIQIKLNSNSKTLVEHCNFLMDRKNIKDFFFLPWKSFWKSYKSISSG